MKLLRKTIDGLLGFNRRERRGTYVLSLLLIVLLAVRLTAFRTGRLPEEIPPLPSAGPSFYRTMEPAAALFNFDPNTVTYDELLKLGLTARQARTLVNYRNSGARFRRPEDLARVYGIDSATLARLMPYIAIRETGRTALRESPAGRESLAESGALTERGFLAERGAGDGERGRQINTAAGRGAAGTEQEGLSRKLIVREDHPVITDLNSCSAEELDELPGIGPVLSVRIIRYRSLLGGFVETDQLREVYGLDSSVVRLIEERLTLTMDSVRPVALDNATFGELARHPYLGYEAARRITRYRSVSPSAITLGAMVRSGVITAGQAERIAPYVRPSPGTSGNDYEFISSKVLK